MQTQTLEITLSCGTTEHVYFHPARMHFVLQALHVWHHSFSELSFNILKIQKKSERQGIPNTMCIKVVAYMYDETNFMRKLKIVQCNS